MEVQVEEQVVQTTISTNTTKAHTP